MDGRREGAGPVGFVLGDFAELGAPDYPSIHLSHPIHFVLIPAFFWLIAFFHLASLPEGQTY
jgi:hypothetical protein